MKKKRRNSKKYSDGIVLINGYRLRVGDFRIIFDINGNVLAIEKIGNRGQIYNN